MTKAAKVVSHLDNQGGAKVIGRVPDSVKTRTSRAFARSLRAAGYTVREVAQLSGLTETRVSKIVNCEYPDQMGPKRLRDLVADQMRIAKAVGGEWGALFAHAAKGRKK